MNKLLIYAFLLFAAVDNSLYGYYRGQRLTDEEKSSLLNCLKNDFPSSFKASIENKLPELRGLPPYSESYKKILEGILHDIAELEFEVNSAEWDVRIVAGKRLSDDEYYSREEKRSKLLAFKYCLRRSSDIIWNLIRN